MKSRILALVLTLLLLFSILPVQAFAAASELTADPVADSDYDGIPNEYDPDPNSNSFSGNYKSGNYNANISYTMDYRNFFGDNTVYNQDIADFSTWAAQLTYENEDNETSYTPAVALRDADGSSITKVYHIDQLMRAHGMENVIDYKLENGYFDSDISLGAYSDDDITEVYFGHREVSYNGETIEVVAVYVRGTNGTEKEWCSNFDVGDLNRYDDEFDCEPGKLPRQLNHDWSRKSNHRGFDVCSTRVRRALDAYLETFVDSEVQPVFWLTGHSRGAAISNITASYLIDAGHKVFAYTFACPNTTANTEASAARFDCIFNLVNGDDFVPRLPMPEWGFTRYGRTAMKYACLASNSERSTYLGNTSYSYASDSSLQDLVDKFAVMTKNNAGVIEGWRDVYVYHCHGGSGVDHDEVHLHAGEVIGEFRSGSRKDFGTDSNWNGYNEHTKKYSYCVKDKDGGFLGLGNKWSCCQTPAYAMQLLAITMGNLGLSAGWDFLTSYKLADRFDFGKTSLITNYATKIIDPHYMENYYLIQKLSELQGDPDELYTTNASLYTDSDHRPVHEHSYTLQPYPDQMPSCTEPGRGDMICNCSQTNAAWYDDIIKDVEIPALGHDLSYQYVGADTHAPYCSRCENSFAGEPCTYDENNTCTLCGHVKAESRVVTVYVVDELDGQSLCAWAWGDAGNLDAAWPGHALTALGTEKNGHPFYSIELDIADYSKLIFNRNGQPQTGNLDIAADAGANNYVIYYIYGVSGNDLLSSQGTDIWPAPGEITAPGCTTPGYTTYYGMFTGALETGNETPALGHDYAAVVTAPSCTAPGYTTWTCSRCGDSYTELTAEALGHDYAAVVTEPSCTLPGCTVYTCSRCGYSYEDDITDPLGHLPGEAVQENYVEPTATEEGGFDTVIYCLRCGEELERTHTTLPATGPAEPIEIDTIRIYPSISIGIEVLASFSVRSTDLSSYESWYIEVSKLDGAGNVIESKRFGDGQEGAVSGSFVYKADYRDITAKELGVPFTASVHAFDANGQEYVSHNVVSNSPVFTVRDYILGELVNEDNADATRKLAADLLNYGAAAQVYFGFDTENLVNENLSTEAQAAMDEFATTGEAPAVLVNNANSANIFSSVSVMNRIMLTLSVRGFSSAGAVQIEIKDHETGAVKEIVDAEKLGTIWRARYSGFEAEDMRTAFDFTVIADGTASGTPITWSVEGYAREARLNEDSSPEELALLNALLHYVDAAAAVDFGN